MNFPLKKAIVTSVLFFSCITAFEVSVCAPPEGSEIRDSQITVCGPALKNGLVCSLQTPTSVLDALLGSHFISDWYMTRVKIIHVLRGSKTLTVFLNRKLKEENNDLLLQPNDIIFLRSLERW